MKHSLRINQYSDVIPMALNQLNLEMHIIMKNKERVMSLIVRFNQMGLTHIEDILSVITDDQIIKNTSAAIAHNPLLPQSIDIEHLNRALEERLNILNKRG